MSRTSARIGTALIAVALLAIGAPGTAQVGGSEASDQSGTPVTGTAAQAASANAPAEAALEPSAARTTAAAGAPRVATAAMAAGSAQVRLPVVAKDDASARPNTCVIAVPTQVGSLLTVAGGAYQTWCSGTTGEILVEVSRSASLRFFAFVGTGAEYGAQWVGADGGTGDIGAAKVVAAVADTVTEGPTVKLDRSGSIYGSLGPDETVADVCVHVMALPFTTPSVGRTCAYAVSEGSPRFEVKGLGPYAWPLFFVSASGRQQVWSGGSPTRAGAQLIAVTAGQKTTIHQDIPEGTGGVVKVAVPIAAGGGFIAAYDAFTGDFLAKATFPANATSVRISGLPGRPAVLQYHEEGAVTCWPRMPAYAGERVGAVDVVVGQTTAVTIDVATGCAASAALLGKPLLPRREDGSATTPLPRR